jgi:hypothetical protein
VLAPADVPAWEPQDENCKLVVVQRGTDEWVRIQAQLQASLPGAEVVQVLRVQNKLLDFTYNQRKERMQMTNEAAPLEMWLWHGAHPASVCLLQYCSSDTAVKRRSWKYLIGTGKTDPETIYSDKQDGFMMQHAGDNNLWGKGIYFAEMAAYSNSNNYVFFQVSAGLAQLRDSGQRFI